LTVDEYVDKLQALQKEIFPTVALLPGKSKTFGNVIYMQPQSSFVQMELHKWNHHIILMSESFKVHLKNVMYHSSGNKVENISVSHTVSETDFYN